MRLCTAILGTLALGACAGSPTPGADGRGPPPGASQPGGDTGWAPGPGTEPTWTAAEAEAAIDRLLDRPVLGSVALRRVYLDLVRAGDEACPGDQDQLAQGAVPLEGCTASTGYHYQGLAEYLETGSPEGAWDFTLLTGDFYITDPAGEVFAVGGNFGHRRDAAGSWSAIARGSFSYPPAGGWLGASASLSLQAEGSGDPATTGAMRLTGGLGTLPAGDDLYFDDVAFEAAGDCSREPAGGLQVKGPEGLWYAVTLDCSGCGPLVAGGRELGEACVAGARLRAALAAGFAEADR